VKLLIVNPGTDIAGCGIALKYAFDRHAPEWTAHHVRRLPSIYDYPTDRPWSELESLWLEADLVHVMDDPRILRELPARPNVFVQYLGSTFRKYRDELLRICREYGARQTGSLDLLGPDIEWLPVAFDSANLQHNGNGQVKIAHAPTDRALKSTDLIIEAVGRLPVAFDLIERVPHRECLDRKAQADIYVDELTLGYGLNAIECWAMGIPVVSGMTIGREALTFEVPWEDATAATLYDVLLRLVESADQRKLAADRGKAHVERYHAPAAVVQRVLELAA